MMQFSLPAEYDPLVQQVVEHQHQAWCRQQDAAGWQWGDRLDPVAKRHPELKPYAELTPEQQQTWRSRVRDTVRSLLALGYRLESGAPDSSRSASAADLDHDMLNHLKLSNSDLGLNSLLAIHRETIRLQPGTPDVYLAVGDSILQLGEPLIAYDILAEGLKHWPQDVKLRQRLALALARSSATQSAYGLLNQLVQEGYQDNETLGLLARVHKDLWMQANHPQAAQYHLQQAVQRYREAYQLHDSVWTGINAATLSLLSGDRETAQALARLVQQQCLERLQVLAGRPQDDPYWLLATVGEAALVLGDWTQAEDYYQQAAVVGRGRYGNLSSSRRNAVLLVEYWGEDPARLKPWFQMPRIAMFCSQILGCEAAAPELLAPELESPLAAAIAQKLRQWDARLGYASAACGPDLLFLEAVRSLEGELHIVLPYNREQFVRDAVDIVPNSAWVSRFDQVMEQASEVVFASDRKPQMHDVVYEYAQRLLHGLAKMRAQHLDTDLVPIAIADSDRAPLPALQQVLPLGNQAHDALDVIDLAQLRRDLKITLPAIGSSPRPLTRAQQLDIPPPRQLVQAPAPAAFERQIRAMLFADVVQFTRLVEEQYFAFLNDFMGEIAQLSTRIDCEPLTKNTWGDAIYYVFPTIAQAGRFALELCDLVQARDWAQAGLPADMNLRIALHAGPVYRSVDPITNQMMYFGAHVNHAARIEPITPPGKVYASQAFAAITCSEGIQAFTCDYVGQMPWAKRYGTFPTYHVRWDRRPPS